MAEQIQPTIKIIRRKQVESRLGLCCSAIYGKLKYNEKRPKEFDPSFPTPISLGPKAVGWIESEIDTWLAAQIEKSRGPANRAVPTATQALANK